MIRFFKLAFGVVLLLSEAILADQKPTVFAVAKVDGFTKTVDGQLYYLIAVRCYDPDILAQAYTGVGLQYVKPALHFGHCEKGRLPILELEANESKSWAPDFFHQLHFRWVSLPKKGTLKVRYGLVWKTSDGISGDVPRKPPFEVDVATMPVVKAKSARELKEAMDRQISPAKDEDSTGESTRNTDTPTAGFFNNCRVADCSSSVKSSGKIA